MALLKLLTLRTLATMGSALTVAVFFIYQCESSNPTDSLPIYVVWRLLGVGNTLFHEMGHALFFWIFGAPAIPSILTLYGTDQAAGITRAGNHSWIVQIIAWAALAYGCLLLRQRQSAWFWPSVFGLCTAVPLSFTICSKLIPLYMGHGGSILAGGVLLYRAWVNNLRTALERWMNALFGFFIVIHNALFCYQLLYVESFRNAYETHSLEGDFVAMTDYMPHWRVDGIALFTLAYAVLTLILSFVLAIYFYEGKHSDSDYFSSQ